MARYGMAIDLTRCSGCQTCVITCQMHHNTRPGIAWGKVETVEIGTEWPEVDRVIVPHACLHCDDAPCVGVCPTGASFQRADGVVLVDCETCIGCGVCLTACPYGARTINTDERWFFDSAEAAPYEDASSGRIGVAEKCTLCADRIDRGLAPACVEACLVGVRAFGDLDDAQGNLATFIEETGACLVAGTGALYADGGRALDAGSLIAERWYAPSGDNAAEREEGSLDVDPAFLAGATAVYTGVLLAQIEAVALWNPLVAPLFALSSLSVGAAGALGCLLPLDEAPPRAVRTLARFDTAAIALEGLCFVAYLVWAALVDGHADLVAELLAGPGAGVLWVGFALPGIAAPFALEAAYGRTSRTGLLTAAVPLIAAGGFFLRYCIVSVPLG